MFELTKEEIKYLLHEYDITKNDLILIALKLSSLRFIKTREEYLQLCEAACFRYQNRAVDNEYKHTIKKYGHKININDVICDALRDMYEEKDLCFADKEELENVKIRLLTDKTTH